MIPLRLLIVPLLISAFVTSLAPSAKGAEATVATRVVSVALVAAPTLSGAEVGLFRVRMHLTNSVGVTPHPVDVGIDQTLPCPCVLLQADRAIDPLSTRTRYVPLRLTSGTATDGTWSGTALSGGGDAGVWHITGVALDDDRLVNAANVLPASPRVNVRSQDWVRISLDPLAPRTGPVPPAGYADVLRGHASWALSGKPAAGVRVRVMSDGCVFATHLVSRAAVTDRLGRWSFARPDFTGKACAVSSPGPTVDSAVEQDEAVVGSFSLGLRAAAHRVGRGGALALTANVARARRVRAPASIWLQRWVRSGWVDVRRSKAASSTVALLTHPPRGLSFYRVSASGAGYTVASPSIAVVGG